MTEIPPNLLISIRLEQHSGKTFQDAYGLIICDVLEKTMKFINDKGQAIELNFQNFESILPDTKDGFTRVKFKNGNEDWIKAPNNEILEATMEE